MADANEIPPEVQRLIDEARAEGRAEGRAKREAERPEVQQLIDDARAAGRAEREEELQPVISDLNNRLGQYRYRFLLENNCKRDYLRLRPQYMQGF